MFDCLNRVAMIRLDLTVLRIASIRLCYLSQGTRPCWPFKVHQAHVPYFHHALGCQPSRPDSGEFDVVMAKASDLPTENSAST
jgi:hypothetical protein